MYNKDIIKKFNFAFNNYESLSDFCNKYSNDVDLIIEEMNKIIKFCFVGKIHGFSNIFDAYNDYDKELLDEEYDKYLSKSKKRFQFDKLKKKKIEIDPDFIDLLDFSIRIEDLEYFNIPNRKRLEEVCKNNISNIKYEESKLEKRKNFYDEKRGFSGAEFIYMRSDKILLDKSFIYYHPDLSGDSYLDLKYLYEGERYSNNFFNPLKNSLSTNLDDIRSHNDITLRKYGDVYHIDNGRHRILYLLNSTDNVVIPVSNVIRRIEDKEYNNILKMLTNKHKVVVSKNNLLNDEADVLLELDNYLYNIKDKDELLRFYNNLENGISNDDFFKVPCKKNDRFSSEENVRTCYKMLYNKYLEYGDYFLKSNFTDVFSYFNLDNYFCLHKAFNLIQYDYQRASVFGYDFNKSYEIMMKVESMSLESGLESKGRFIK